MNFTKYALELLGTKDMPLGVNDLNPFVTEDGTTYCQFDGIRLDNADDTTGDLLICSMWRGQDINFMRVRDVKITGICGEPKSIQITGIEGKQLVSLSLA